MLRNLADPQHLLYLRGLSPLLWHQIHPPQVVEAKEKTSLCRSFRVLICKLTLTLAEKIAGVRP